MLRGARDRADLLALGGLLLAVPLLPGATPGGIYGRGIVTGMAVALQVTGLILVYRANRIINFAQVQIGVTAALLFRLLVEQRTMLRALRAACGPCFPRESELATGINYWLSLVLSLLFAALVSVLLYRFVVRRFADAPRLVLTVATIGIAQLLASIQSALPGMLATEEQERLSQLPTGVAAPPPLDWTLRWEPAVFRAPDILLVLSAAVVIGGLIAGLRRSRSGIAIRAAAENRDRASTLGIDVDRTTQRVWLTAGVISGLAGVLVAMAQPAAPPAPLDVAATVRMLAAGVIASLTSIPIGAVAALVIGLFDQAMLWSFRSSAHVDGLMTAVIALVLLVQRARASRLEEALAGAWRAAREVRPIPDVLRGLPAVRRVTRGGAALGAVAVIGFPFVMSPSQTNRWSIVLIYAMVGMSLLILSGWAGQVSLGQFAFAAVGGYAAAMLAGTLPQILCVVAGALAGALAATAAGVPALRLRGLHLAITTLAFALTTSAVLLSPRFLGALLPDEVARGSLLGISLESHRGYYFFTLVMLAATVALTMGLRRSRIGRGLIAARDNEAAARSFGIAPVRARLGAFAISGGIAGAAGALFVFHQFGLKAASFTPDVSVLMFLMAVIGGLGAIAGPLIGAAVIGVLSLLAAGPLVVFLATGGGVVALLLFAPGGLVQLFADVRDSWLRRVAARNHIVVPSLLADTARAADRTAPLQPRTGPVPYRYQPEGAAP